MLGIENVYFNPPESVKMRYPACRYELGDIQNQHADNIVFRQHSSYTVTLIDFDPDSTLPEKMSKIPRARFNRHFVASNLHHWVFTIYKEEKNG